MANAFACFEHFDFVKGQDVYDPFQVYEWTGGVNKGQKPRVFGSQDWDNVDYLSSGYGFYQENSLHEVLSFKHQIPQQQQPFSEFDMTDGFQCNIVSPPIQSPQQSTSLDMVVNELSELIQPKEKAYTSSITSLEVLNKSGLKRMNGQHLYVQPIETLNLMGSQRLSTEEVMRVAGAQYLQSSVQHEDNLSMLMHPFGCSLSGLTDDETKDVQLAQLLLASAEKVGNQQFDRASRLLTQCDYMSSSTGGPVQRVVYCFAEGLRERIFRETGRAVLRGFPMNVKEEVFNIDEAMLTPNAEILACHQALPFAQVVQFPGVQAIIENVASARKVHLIDLGIKLGVQWTVLMQALAARQECRIELFKITAVGTSNTDKIKENRDKIEGTGKRLASFAKSMALPFSFKVVMVSDMKDIKEDLFHVEDGEAITVYAPFILRTMISRPDRLDSLMRVIRSFNPCIMVVTEVEANHNSPSFFNRFIEALFFYGAFFDCLEDCMDRNNHSRLTMEGKYFGQGIMNMVSTEGEERTHRHVGIDVWRAFFARFGWVETEFSHSSMYQASLLLKQVACGSSCTLDMNGKSLTVGWKGTPIHALSAWKLSNI